MTYIRLPNSRLPGRGLKQTPLPNGDAGVIPVTIDADIATTTSLGVIQVGAGLAITPEGVLSATGGSDCCCKARTITGNYTATVDDYYIGVVLPQGNDDDDDDDDHNKGATLKLPHNPPDCIQYIVKLQYGAPVGNRKLKIQASGSNKIDGQSFITLTTPYQSVSLFSQDGAWWLV